MTLLHHTVEVDSHSEEYSQKINSLQSDLEKWRVIIMYYILRVKIFVEWKI